MTLFVFNPEHDLCLANGDPNYVPPQSALDFARRGVGVMKVLYGDDVEVIAADDFASWCSGHKDICENIDAIVPWGWDARLKQMLVKQGVKESLLPTDLYIKRLREMQHRSTILPLQSAAYCVYKVGDVIDLLVDHPRIVLKAPWSGSGRGLRWVDEKLSEQDESWIRKTVASQRCVIAEERYDVKDDFAFEYYVENGLVEFVGMSFFVTQSGVYRHNILLPDEAIRIRCGVTPELGRSIKSWLQISIAPYYNGYLGVDCFSTQDGRIVVSEINLRHTMGLVAHRYLERHPECKGQIWTQDITV